jgi:excisionase family DNA binding protein
MNDAHAADIRQLTRHLQHELDELVDRINAAAASPPPAVRAVGPEEAARQLGLSSWVVRNMLREGRLRGIKEGTTWVVPTAAIDEFLEGSTP